MSLTVEQGAYYARKEEHFFINLPQRSTRSQSKEMGFNYEKDKAIPMGTGILNRLHKVISASKNEGKHKRCYSNKKNPEEKIINEKNSKLNALKVEMYKEKGKSIKFMMDNKKISREKRPDTIMRVLESFDASNLLESNNETQEVEILWDGLPDKLPLPFIFSRDNQKFKEEQLPWDRLPDKLIF